MTWRLLPVWLATVLLIAATAAAKDDAAVMDAEIDRLLADVRSSDCAFIRNGDEHGARAAADHLQMKRRRGRRYFDSTEEFIERIASRSSWSGKPYRIRCGGDNVTAAAWFGERLAAMRAAP